MDEVAYSQLLDIAYDAALDPDLWPRVLAGFCDLVGARGAVLIEQNEETGKGSGIRANIDPEATDLYYGHFATRNVLQRSESPREWLRRWTPRVLTDEHKMPKEALMRSEYYNDFMRRFDIHSLLIVRLAVRDMDAVSINLTRPASRGQFDAAELEVAGRAHAHLIRAFGLGRKIASARGLADDLAGALDRSLHGLFLIDETGKVRHANHAGQALVAEAGGLCMISGRLSAMTQDRARTLEALIAAAASADPQQRRGGSMALPSPSRRLPLSVTVAPVRAQARPIFDTSPSVIVCVSDLEAGVGLPEQKLRDLFGLTAAESRVALALFEGASPGEAADQFGVSPHTVRFQLARILEKTGAHRQSDLVRLMMRAVGAG